MFDQINQLSPQAEYLFYEFVRSGVIEPDYESSSPDCGIADIALEKSLYLRTVRLLNWRETALHDGKTPKEVRKLESDVRWAYGRALLPSTNENPLGVPEAFSINDDTVLQEYVELFLDDHLYTSETLEKGSQPDNTYALHLGRIAGLSEKDGSAQDYKKDFLRNKDQKLGRLNGYLDDLAWNNAFYEIDTNFVGMSPVKDAIWKLYKADRFSAKRTIK